MLFARGAKNVGSRIERIERRVASLAAFFAAGRRRKIVKLPSDRRDFLD
jgi:hypothetical protein